MSKTNYLLLPIAYCRTIVLPVNSLARQGVGRQYCSIPSRLSSKLYNLEAKSRNIYSLQQLGKWLSMLQIEKEIDLARQCCRNIGSWANLPARQGNNRQYDDNLAQPCPKIPKSTWLFTRTLVVVNTLECR